MATRLKTVQFAFDPIVTTINDATVTDFVQRTIHIPETVVSFVSVTAEVGFQDLITATGGTIDEHRVGLRLGASAYTTFTELANITNSGENLAGVIGPIDFTSHFTTNWTGTSMTCDMQVYFDQNTGTTLGITNVTSIITVTYQYDDDPATNATQIKTAWIPLESLVDALSTTANSNIGTNQVPQLTGVGGMLPEDSVTIRDYFFVIEGNQSVSNNVTDFTPSVNIDSGTAFTFGLFEAGLASDSFTRLVWRPTVPDTTTTHNFQMWATTARMNHITITLVVTYEFNAAATTRILNSMYIPAEVASPMGQNIEANASRFNRRITVQEANPSLAQSAVRINFNTPAAVAGLRVRAGSQAYRLYTHAGSVVCGMYSLQQRIDSGSEQGAGFTLARGFNEINVDMYTTDVTNDVTNINGYLLINYTSDVPTQGIGAANHTVMMKLLEWNAALSDINRINNYAVTIPETDYWLTSAGFAFIQWVAAGSMAVTFDVECLSGESKGAGYTDIYVDAYRTDPERACSIIWMRGRDAFKRYPQDPDPDRLDIETARDYRLFSTTTTSNGMYAVLTYHSISYTASDSISGFSGTVNLALHRATTGEKVAETTRSGDGSFSFTWYDNTEQLYVTASDGTNVGRSQNTLAT